MLENHPGLSAYRTGQSPAIVLGLVLQDQHAVNAAKDNSKPKEDAFQLLP